MTHEKEAPKMVVPFSNGSEACDWYSNNCSCCKKAWHPDPNKPTPSMKTMKEYRRIGKYCPMQFDIDDAFVTGEIPAETYQKIWPNGRWYEQPEDSNRSDSCAHWSDDNNDGFNYPKRPQKPPPANQLPLFTEFDELVKPRRLLVREIG